jgi:hypothetical protein
MKRKKKATEAEAVGFSMDVPGIVLEISSTKKRHIWVAAGHIPLNESRIEIIIMDIKRPKDPHIMGWRRPYRSEKKVG